MIFVTVGTHEQPFNRLIKHVDRLVQNKKIEEEVFMQIGYSTYEPKYTKWGKLISYESMELYMNTADTIITHGGPATYMNALLKNKRVIVVPRQKKYGEHVNDHQLDFALKVKEKGYQVEVISNVEEIYDILTKKIITTKLSSNNNSFCSRLQSLIMN